MDSGAPAMEGGTTMDGATMADAADPDGGGMCTLGIDYGTQSCTSCMRASCCDKDNACVASQDCVAILQCADPCTDKACVDACRSQWPAGAAIVDELVAC